jgi:uncharacterized protein (DUF952 family)
MLFHIALPGDWAAAATTGRYPWSTRGRTVVAEGFTHLSYRHQLTEVANRYYGDCTTLLILTVDPARLRATVRDVAVPGGSRYPHLYSELPLDAVVTSTTWRRSGATWIDP